MKCIFEVNTICRLCLRVDEKVNKLNSAQHRAFVDSVIKLKKFTFVPTEDHYVCYICNALIIKTYNFMQTIWKAQEIISGLLKNTDMVTKPMLENIERNDNGLNPVTLSSVVTCDNEFMYGICENTDLEIQFEDEKEGQSTQKQKNKESSYIDNIKNHYTNEIYRISSSDEGIRESDKCLLDEVEIDINSHLEKVDVKNISGDPLEENKNLKQKFIKDSHIKAHAKPGEKKKMGLPLKKNPYKSEDSSSHEKEILSKKKVKVVDDDYQPDSTSDSEDSEYDLYDDRGRQIKKPKDDRIYPRQCDHCDFEVPRKSDHYRHYQYVHPNIDYPFASEKNCTCSICGKQINMNRVRSHEDSHTTQKLKCPLCPKVFPNKIKRYRHLQKVHPKKTFTCSYCSKIFKTKTDFHRHIRTHTGSKPFKCHICGDSFAHSGNRNWHVRSKHQNLKYLPKKQSQKVRRKKTRDSTDTELTFSDDETVRTIKNTKTKTRRKRKNQPESTDAELKTMKNKTEKRVSNRNKRVDCTDTAMVLEDGKQKDKRKKTTHMGGDRDRTNDNYDTCMNINHRNKKQENAETESDDEILATIKKKRTRIKN